MSAVVLARKKLSLKTFNASPTTFNIFSDETKRPPFTELNISKNKANLNPKEPLNQNIRFPSNSLISRPPSPVLSEMIKIFYNN